MSTPLLEQFGRACGLGGPLELLVTPLAGGGNSVRHQLNQPVLLVGRSSLNDVVLNHDTVSRRHAYFQVLGGRLLCIDLGSRTGLRWPDGRRRSGWLAPSESVRIGNFEVALESCPVDAMAMEVVDDGDPLTARAADPSQLASISLEIATHTTNPTIWPMPQCIALAGRASSCSIRAADERLSSYHCSFVKTASGLWIVDLLSEGGTRINGELARAARLRDADIVRAGPLTVVVRSEMMAVANSMVSYSGGSAALISLPNPPVEPPAPPGVVPETIKETVAAMVTPMHDLMRQFQECLLVMSKMFTSVQEQQLALARDQLSEFQKAARELREIRSEIAAAPFAEGAPEPPFADLPPPPETQLPPAATPSTNGQRPTSSPPPPKPLPASAANELANAHAWLTKRLGEMERQLGSPPPGK